MSWHRPTKAAALVVAASAAIAAWPRPASSHETVNTTVLFDREIVRILNSHCVMCHVDGGPSFPLTTYEEAWLQRRKITLSDVNEATVDRYIQHEQQKSPSVSGGRPYKAIGLRHLLSVLRQQDVIAAPLDPGPFPCSRQ